jgi:Chaperone for flagella basal body P-ring formation
MSAGGGRPLPYPLYVPPLVLLALLLIVFFVVRSAVFGCSTQVVVAANPVAAGALIEEDDLRVEDRNGYGVDDDAVVTSADGAAGHRALVELTEGGVVKKADVTGAMDTAEDGEQSLRFRTKAVTINDVKSGQRVALLVAPTGTEPAPEAQDIEATLLSHPKDGEDGVVWVMIADDARDALLRFVARARLVIAPAP